jgi:guanylate kinase
VVVISAPSGGGKNAVIQSLVERIADSARFVTTTTRSPRPGERDGVDYHYMSAADFDAKRAAGRFVETNQYAENWYGTDRDLLEQELRGHRVVFAALDVNGKKALDRTDIPHLSIFLLPESPEILADRIRRRGGVSEAELAVRIETARHELAAADGYDARIVNAEGKLDETIREVLAFLQERGLLDKKAAA